MYDSKKAFNSLKYSPKGQEVAGIPGQNVDKKVFFWLYRN
jgi:hypothetical protein